MDQMSQTSIGESATLLNEFFSEDDLARELSTSRKTLARWEKIGLGPRRTKIGRRIFYNRRAVREWLESCESRQHDRRQHGSLRGSRRA